MSQSPTNLPPAPPTVDDPPAGVPSAEALPSTTAIVPAASPVVQLAELPNDDLHALAEALGLLPATYPTRQQLVSAIHYRRQLIAAIHLPALQELLTWSGRYVPAGASKEAMALQITS